MKLSPYRISNRVLRLLSAAIVVMFVAFFLVGYDRYFDEDSRFKAPLLTDTLIAFTALFVIATLAVTIWAGAYSLRQRGADSMQDRLVPVRRIHMAITAGVCIVAVLAWLLGSPQPIIVNGQTYTAAFWLRTSDMFVVLCTVLTACALAAVAYSSYKSMHHGR